MSKTLTPHFSSSRALATGLAASLISIAGAHAQLCFDVFSADSHPLLQCADADYFVVPTDGGFDNAMQYDGHDTGSTSAAFDGTDLFSGSGMSQPPHIGTPFFSSTNLSTTQGVGGITSFQSDHRGSVSLAPVDSLFQSAAFQTRSRVTFMVINQTDPGAPLSLSLKLNFTFNLTDPLANVGSGAALGGFGIKFIGGDDDAFDDPIFDVSTLAELDSSETEDPLEFFGFDDPDLDGATTVIQFEPSAPGVEDSFDIEIDIDLDLILDGSDLSPGESLILELDTFGSVFTDGFSPGDSAALRMDSPGTFTFDVASNDPNARFLIIPEPSACALLLLAGCGLLNRRRW